MVVFYLQISKILTFFIDFDKKMLGRMLLLSSGAKRNTPINSVWPYMCSQGTVGKTVFLHSILFQHN